MSYSYNSEQVILDKLGKKAYKKKNRVCLYIFLVRSIPVSINSDNTLFNTGGERQCESKVFCP